jgi:CO/xanthine dehydrogenase Mo-binding subunit
MKKKPLKIGERVARADALSKVTGKCLYAADQYGDHFLWAGVKRAGVAHARLTGINTKAAKGIKGVFAVLTCRDVPGTNRMGIIRQDQPVLADTKIRHCGDPVALVVAEDRDSLKDALEAITFEYQPLPGLFDQEEALKERAPKIHEDSPEGNLIRAVSVKTGQADGALARCDVVEEGLFEVPFLEHAYLETEAGWARMEEDGTLIIVASTQTPFRDVREIAPALGLDAEKIRIIAPYLGGAFGGKDGVTVQGLLGLAAMHSSGRPVKMWWDREESFLAGVKRLAARMYYRLGAKRDGTLHALSCRLYYDGGAYAGLGGEVMTLGAEHAGSAYRIPHVSIEGWCSYTNNPAGGPFRGFGVPQVTAAMEQMVDMVAARLKIDPLILRMKNGLRKGDRNCMGVSLTYSTGVMECLETLSNHAMWRERQEWKASAPPSKFRGVGIACMAHAMGYPPIVPDFSNAKIEITAEGKVRVYAGIVDMGQGNASTYVQIAGEILGQDASAMELVLPDTARTLPSGSSSASRCTYVYGNALIPAAKALKKRLQEKAALLLKGSSPQEITFLPGRVHHPPTGRKMALSRVARTLDEEQRISTAYYQAPAAKGMDQVIYMGPHVIFSYGAHLAYVEVDRATGKVEVKKYLAATDAGRVLNPQLYEQQVQGSLAQGMGYALWEDLITEKGAILTADLSTYKIPTSVDVPETISIPVEIEEESGPFGMKGVGEINVSGPLPAIANGVADACGVRLTRAPFTAEKVWGEMRRRGASWLPRQPAGE